MENVKHYRLEQFKRLNPDGVYNPTIKIFDGSNSSTNYLDITRPELEQIKKLLTGDL
jgi:hypothetical protein